MNSVASTCTASPRSRASSVAWTRYPHVLPGGTTRLTGCAYGRAFRAGRTRSAGRDALRAAGAPGGRACGSLGRAARRTRPRPASSAPEAARARACPASVMLTTWRRRSCRSRWRTTRPRFSSESSSATSRLGSSVERLGDRRLRLPVALGEDRQDAVVVELVALLRDARDRPRLDLRAEPGEQEAAALGELLRHAGHRPGGGLG